MMAWLNRHWLWIARISLAIIYIWFGLLKLLGLSPALDLVQALARMTIPMVPFDAFYIVFGGFEIAVGILFLIRGWERIAVAALLFHLLMTSLPLFVVPGMVWAQPFVPNLEGQYIIKNLALAALGLAILSQANRKAA
jgi:uncharacterized membrane protein YphA (DoxX/SURF4 family)